MIRKVSVRIMNKESEFPFKAARRITEAEVIEAQQAIKEQFNIEIPDREKPTKTENKNYQSISICLHPQIIQWAKKEAEKRGIGYETVINEELLKITEIG